ncbi:hypothetical protein JCM3263A_02880 [Thermobifida fusca]|jgi:hypothetical protein|uniref:Uncharacterized protein n=1 Tax=Thermobifida fusca (strain YX) TaxID=269800 RepID=Q47MF9_THEFY|nr:MULTISPECIES: DUF6114 domain-containing protein [Thermobifida]AAZ56363.1 hypothetical protein Tfu_2330 [Thermobifida fusca YX]MBO2531112.1 hypothetical protein [Thermobifida sp.]PPS92143.1 hypothetical protein BH05_11525 [Thermobifida fusca]PZN60995.1 MAG: hypothetical protein DIU53_14090 [Thermobifida fusca]
MTQHARTSHRAVGPFARWRRSRPLWGGLLTILAGAEIVAAPLAPLPFLVYQGIAGISGYLIGAALVALGVLAWLHPAQRAFYGIVAVLLSLASFLTSNFGGFVIGMLLGIIGGALIFAWEPHRPPKRRQRDRTDTETAPAESSPTAETEPADDEDHDEDREPDTTTPDRGGQRGSTTHALVAAPLALTLVLASAPADWWWPWDQWFNRGGNEQSEPQDTPGTPTPAPSAQPADPPEPGTEPAEEDPENPEPGDEAADGEDDEETDDEESEPDTECEIRTGPVDEEVTEEEFLDAVEACQHAAETGDLPEVQTLQADDRFPASPTTSGLTADRIIMSGSYFAGVVEYPTSAGTDRYLKLGMSRADFDNAVLWWMDGEEKVSIDLPDMTMQGDVVMYVTRMKVRILGIPLVFTPDFPPPLLLPFMIVTDVDVSRPVAHSNVLTVDNIEVRAGS